MAILTPYYWPEVRRGAERVAHELAHGLRDDGYSVRLITSHPGFPRRMLEDGIEVLRLWRPPDARLRRRLFEDGLTHAQFSYLSLLAGRDDVAHAQAAPDAIAAGRWARRRGGVSLFSYMGIPERQFLVKRRARVATMLAACHETDCVVALSRAAADAFQRDLGVRARVIHPGVDVERFSPGHGRAAQPTIFCNAPPEVGYKRVAMLVRALPLLRRSRRDARLVLIRPADERLAAKLLNNSEGLELITTKLGADDSVLVENYRRAWVSVLPSRAEAFGLALAESLACGTPAVGTAAGGMPEIIDRPEVGRLFRGEEDSLARALLEALELAEQPDTASACRTRALELSTRRSTESFETLYQHLLDGRSRA